ncbi:MAG: DUF1186 domain-containing protein [Flavobacteriaceae bacterium]|nr:DUF1186 domain-containing protein [Flavobacteriaceae bacterium]
MTPELHKKLEKLHDEALKGRKSSINKFHKLIEKYPKNPQLKNYLSVLYVNMDDMDKAREVNHWILAEHPDYLFGKLNLAFEYYAKKKFSKMPEILGDGIELKILYPDRDEFHIVEVMAMLKAAVFYYGAIGDLAQAEIRFKIMKDLEPDSYDTEQAQKQLMSDRLSIGHERYLEEEKNKIKVEVNKTKTIQKTTPPVFTHVELNVLYQKGFDIGEEVLKSVLGLPRETLIRDLELILKDSIDRYAYFDDKFGDHEITEDGLEFVNHSLFLLGELESSGSINSVLHILRQEEEYYELFFGDLLTETIWEPFYKIANNQLDILREFMYEPGIYTYAKSIIPDIVEQVFIYQDRREEVIDWYEDVLSFYFKSSLDDNVIDSDVIAFVISGITDLKIKKLLPIIKKLFDRKIVSTGICGSFSDIEKDINSKRKSRNKRELLTIFDRYEQTNAIFEKNKEQSGSDFFDSPYEKDEYEYKPPMTIVKDKKVGRNEPCPCGSGKKYKKCCINK